MLGRLSLTALVVFAACTPGMHKAYRTTVAVAGGLAQVVDTRQTQWGVAHGWNEANPFLGSHPSYDVLAAGAVTSVVFMVAWHKGLERLPDRGPESEWVRDVLATLPLIIEGTAVTHNLDQIGAANTWHALCIGCR